MNTASPPNKPRSSRAARKFAAGWLLSAAIHAALAVAAFFIVWSTALAPPAPPPSMVSFEAPSYAPVVEAAPEPADSQTTQQAVPLPAPTAPPVDLSALLNETAAPRRIAAPSQTTLDDADPLRAAPPERSRTVNFSGLGATDARDILYVVDASGSMVTSMPAVLDELKRSITALHPTQRFNVLLFQNADGAGFIRANLPPGSTRPLLLDATRRHKKHIFDWLDRAPLGGASDPRPALRAAFTMKPDAIFLLSAGALTGPDGKPLDAQAILSFLDELNPVRPSANNRRVVIKAIQILRQDERSLLRAIGGLHGGEDGYRFISASEFNQPTNPGMR